MKGVIKATFVACTLGVLTACSGHGSTVTAPVPTSPGIETSPGAPAEESPGVTPTTVPSALPTTASPTAKPTPTAAALTGQFKNDPGVKLMLRYIDALRTAINTGHPASPALLALVTAHEVPLQIATNKGLAGEKAPDTVPFVPIAVAAQSSTHRTVSVCLLQRGWTLNPKTGKPADARRVIPAIAEFIKSGSSWKLELKHADFSCAGVKM